MRSRSLSRSTREAKGMNASAFSQTMCTSLLRTCPRSVLRVVFSTPALKNEVSFKLTDLRNAINQQLGREEVQRIVLL